MRRLKSLGPSDPSQSGRELGVAFGIGVSLETGRSGGIGAECTVLFGSSSSIDRSEGVSMRDSSIVYRSDGTGS